MTQEIIPTTKDEQERKKLEEKDFFDMLKPKKTINIAVSGRVTISEIEQNIIDTPAFQRLRGIRQLGAACQVYPTALHTRFDHSIGTLEMVKQMISKIRDNMHSEGDEKEITAEEETLARLYALLHDITHVPFGHMLEDELGVFNLFFCYSLLRDDNTHALQSNICRPSLHKSVIKSFLGGLSSFCKSTHTRFFPFSFLR